MARREGTLLDLCIWWIHIRMPSGCPHGQRKTPFTDVFMDFYGVSFMIICPHGGGVIMLPKNCRENKLPLVSVAELKTPEGGALVVEVGSINKCGW